LFRNKFTPPALPEIQPPFVVVVAPAAQLDVVDAGLSTQGVGIDVVEFDEAPLVASMAARSHERAPSEVANPDRALDRRRNVATAGSGSAMASRSRARRPFTRVRSSTSESRLREMSVSCFMSVL